MTGLCAATMGPGPATAATLSGVLVLQERGQPAAGLAGAMVHFIPEAGVQSPPPPVAAEIVMRDRRFGPRTISVPVGSTVRFVNADPIRHNVFSVSPGNRFDLGLYGEGPGRAQPAASPWSWARGCPHADLASRSTAGSCQRSSAGAVDNPWG